MTTSVYKKAIKRFALNTLKWAATGGSPVKAVLIDYGSYTPNFSTDEYLSDVPSGARYGTAVALTLIDAADDGILDAADVTGYTLPGTQPTLEAILLFSDTGTASTSPLIGIIDNNFEIEISADASSSATTIKPEDLPAAIASGATLTKVSGSGPTTITTSATGAAGDRSLSVTALSGALTAGAVYSYTASGSTLPIAAGATSVDITWDNGTYKILQI